MIESEILIHIFQELKQFGIHIQGSELPQLKKALLADRDVLNEDSLRSLFLIEIPEVFRQGTKGQIHDLKIFAQPWGFNLEDISKNLIVNLWHGEVDSSIPVSMAKRVSKAISTCNATFFPNKGHLSVFYNNMDKLFHMINLSINE